MGWSGGYSAMGAFGGLWMVLVWVAVIGLVLWGASALLRHGPSPDGTREALGILKRRHAAGEITEAEFETARRALG